MSQTETVMLFVLGFCAALLLVLLFGRTIWSLIGRWSGWRYNRAIPKAILELQAERDTLRAEKAMMAKRVETSANDMRMRTAEQMAEVARNRNRVLDLTASLKSTVAEVEAARARNMELQGQVDSLKLQIEENVRAINDAWQKAADHSKATESERETIAALHREIELGKQKILNSEAEIRALREIVVMFVPAQSGDESVERLKRLASSSRPGQGFAGVPQAVNPFEAPGNNGLPASTLADDENAQTLPGETDDDHIERGVSNVLSLAERVRNLQRGMKR